MAALKPCFLEEILHLVLTEGVSNFNYLIRVLTIMLGTFRVKSILRDSVSPSER